jgi:hypothetical protein
LAESNEEREKRLLKELEGKNIAHYSVLLSAWIQTKMERDKTLVTLSSAAIGLLITVLTTIGVQNVYEIILFIIAVCAFLITIYSSLMIYQLNSKHLEDALRGSSKTDPNLEKYDSISIKAFILGAVFALLVGATSAYQKISLKDNNMTNEELSKLNIANKSFNGITKLNPKDIQQPKPEISQTEEQNTTANASNNSTTESD